MKSIINLILALFKKKEPIQEVKVEVKPIISFEDYITASGKYPERLKSPELTDEYKKNAEVLLTKVNRLLNDLGITKASVSSGFRPTAVNATTKGAAKKSNHTVCRAVDIVDDKGQSLSKKIQELEEKADQNGYLIKYDLWLEHPEATKGVNSNWCHLDDSDTRKPRKVRVFRP